MNNRNLTLRTQGKDLYYISLLPAVYSMHVMTLDQAQNFANFGTLLRPNSSIHEATKIAEVRPNIPLN